MPASPKSPRQSNASTSPPKQSDPLWIQIILLVATVAMAGILWLGSSNKPQHSSQKTTLHFSHPVGSAPIRHLPTRNIFPRPVPPRNAKNPPKTVSYNPAHLFYPLPIPLHLKQREAFYAGEFAKAKQLKMGVFEKLLIKRLTLEREEEAKRKIHVDLGVRLEASRYYQYRKRETFLLLGFRQLAEFEARLDQYLRRGGSPEIIPDPHSPHFQRAKALIAHAGHYPMLLRNAGITDANTKIKPEQRFWLRTLFMARWVRYVIGYSTLPILMGETLYEDYIKARFLFARTANQRIWAARELRRLDPNFPTHRALGWLFVQLKQPQFAIQSFRDALKRDPSDRLSRSLLDTLLKSPS